MSHRNRLSEATHDVDVTLAKIGLVASILLLGLRLLAAQVFLVVIPVAIGTACATFLAIHDRGVNEVSLPRLPAEAAGYLPTVVVGGLALLAVSVTVTSGRSIPILVLTGVIGALLIAQILLVDDAQFTPGVVLFEIFAAALVLRLTALFAVPGFVGADVWVHGPVWVDAIAETGSLEPLAESKYLLAPFYHAVGGVGTLLTGSARTGIYLTVGLFVPLSALFVYGVGAMFVPARWALFATALYAFADQFIRWGLHVIPTSLGLAFFIVTLYCVLKVMYTDAQPWVVAALFAFGFGVIFTHQVSAGLLVLLLAVAATVTVGRDAVAGDGWHRSTFVLVAAFVVDLAVTLSTWAVAPWAGGGAAADRDVFLFQMVALARDEILSDAAFLDLLSAGEDSAGSAAGGSSTLASELVPYVELFGFALLLATAVVGGLVMLRWRRRTDATLTLLVTTGLLFVGTFGFSLFGIRLFLPGRWIGFLYVPLVVVAAIGLFHVAEKAPRGVVVGVVLLFALGYPTTMVVAEKATLDDPAFEDRYSRTAFTESELTASATIPQILPGDGSERVHTDHPYWRTYHPQAAGPLVTVVMGDSGPTTTGPIVYRSYQSTGAPSFRVAGASRDASTQRAYDRSEVCPETRNYVYANDDVLLCTNTGEESEGSE